MEQPGINYDAGIEFHENYHSRPEFDITVVKRELEIIRKDLYCNAIRISGTDTQRLIITSGEALKLGFEVWLSPHLHDRNKNETHDYIVTCARAAELLRKQYSKLIFIVGCELTFFMNGIFVFTFVSPALTYSEDPMYDLDMASYSLVRSYVDNFGVTYPDMKCEPKESFRTVADYFSKLTYS